MTKESRSGREELGSGLFQLVFRYGSRFRRAWRAFRSDAEDVAEHVVEPKTYVTRESQPTRLERFPSLTDEAERAGATVREEAGSHAIYVSKPQPVADIIEAAAG
jgi:hypothetical protein